MKYKKCLLGSLIFLTLTLFTALPVSATDIWWGRLDGHSGEAAWNQLDWYDNRGTHHFVCGGDWLNYDGYNVTYPITNTINTTTQYGPYLSMTGSPAMYCTPPQIISINWDENAWHNTDPSSSFSIHVYNDVCYWRGYTDGVYATHTGWNNYADWNNPTGMSVYIDYNLGWGLRDVNSGQNPALLTSKGDLFVGNVSQWSLWTHNNIVDAYCYDQRYANHNWNSNTGIQPSGISQGVNTVGVAACDNAGNMRIANYQYKYDSVAPTANGSDLKNVTDTGFDIYLYNVGDATSGVNRVQVPTWSNNSQYDLRGDWPTNPFCSATNIGGGTWVYHVDKANFNGDMTGFCSDWYLYDNAGNVCGIGSYHGVNLLNRNATVTSDIPATMELGQATTFHVTANNTGTYPWTAATNFRLGEYYGSTTIPGIPGRLYLPAGITIGAGQSYTWTLTVTPTVLGVNNLDWNMLQEGVVWFGSNCVKTVNVVDTKPPTVTYSPNSCTETNNDVPVTITPTDTGGSGVKQYQYRLSIDNCATWGSWVVVGNANPTNYTITTEGTNIIQTQVTDNAGNVATVNSGQYIIVKLTVLAMLTPNPAKQGQQVTFTINTAGSATKLDISFPQAFCDLDSTITNGKITIPLTPQQGSVVTVYQYTLSLYTMLTLDPQDNWLQDPYSFTITATNSSGKSVSCTVNLDVKNNIYTGLRTRMR